MGNASVCLTCPHLPQRFSPIRRECRTVALGRCVIWRLPDDPLDAAAQLRARHWRSLGSLNCSISADCALHGYEWWGPTVRIDAAEISKLLVLASPTRAGVDLLAEKRNDERCYAFWVLEMSPVTVIFE